MVEEPGGRDASAFAVVGLDLVASRRSDPRKRLCMSRLANDRPASRIAGMPILDGYPYSVAPNI